MPSKIYRELQDISDEIRKGVFKIAQKARSGHIGGSSSSVELMASLYFGGILRYSPENPTNPHRDRVLVRGHLGPLRYKIFSMLGWINEPELETYRELDSRLEGHEDMKKVPGVDITPSGSLGMLLSYGVGAAVSARKNKQDFRTYVFLGDGEEQEGNISEAARHAASLKLTNLIAIIDQNKKQLSRSTKDSDGATNLHRVWEGYGWEVKDLLDGHDLDQIAKAYHWATNPKEKPRVIIASTIKGKGVPGCESHYSGYHTISTAKPEDVSKAIDEHERITYSTNIKDRVLRAKNLIERPTSQIVTLDQKEEPTNLSKRKEIYRNLLDGLVDYLQQTNEHFAERPENLYVLTADIIREELVPILGLNNPSTTFIDVGIREQHMTAMAHGIVTTDKSSRVILDAGEEFLYRNADQLNVIGQAKSPIVIIGNMGGICGAKNGQTHQPSGQSGMLTLMPGIECLEPADVTDLFNCLNQGLSKRDGPTYVRMHSGLMPNIPPQTRRNLVAYISKDADDPQLAIVSNGLTLNGCMNASEILAKQGLASRVINVIDRGAIGIEFTRLLVPNKPVLTVYNGNPHSLSYPVSNATMLSGSIRPSHIFSHGFSFGKSGELEDLIHHFKFDGEGIAAIAKNILP